MSKIIKYDNKMNSLNFEKFTSNDFDFFFGICYKMQGKGTSDVILTFSEIAELVQYKETDKKRFIQDIERMYDKVENIQYRYEDSKKIVKFRLFGKFKLFKEKEEVVISIDEEFVSLLNNLTEQFTLFELKQFLELSGKHTKTLFRLCKQWRTNGKTQLYSIEELKKIFDCETYENRDFTKVIVKAIKELKEKNLFKDLEYEPKIGKKRGSPVIGYKFTFESEKKNIHTNYQIEGQANFSDAQTFEEYMKGYQGKDKPTPVDIKIAQDIQKSKERKKNISEKPKKNAFNNFEQRKYDNDELERMLFGNPTAEERMELEENLTEKNKPQEKITGRTSKKELIQEYVLAHQDKSVSEIAKNLGISRTTVYKYINTANTKPKSSKQAKKDIEGTLEAPKAEFVANTKPQGQIPENETPEQRKRRHHMEWQKRMSQ